MIKVGNYILVLIILSSCCIGNRKCQINNFIIYFRLVDKSTNNDLLYGPSKLYNKDDLKLYTIKGIDTITEKVYFSASNTINGDSLVYAFINYTNYENLYLKLNNVDVDTIATTYNVIDKSSCCDDLIETSFIKFNNTDIATPVNGVYTLKK